MNPLRYIALATGLAAASAIVAQDKVTFTGSVQSDVLFPEEDKKIGTGEINDHFLTNTYVDAALMSSHLDGGLRFEYNQYPLPGFESDFKGWGVPHLYVKLHYDKIDVTAGSFYEQFGSGFILRTYEERSLGIDNSLFGGRINARPLPGLSFKALGGVQRCYWEFAKSVVMGGDVELGLDQWIRPLQENGTTLTLGGSVINRHEKDEDMMVDLTHRLNFPQNVNAFDVRANLSSHGFNVLAEYAIKGQDPNYDNGFIYRNGNVTMLSTSYSKPGLSILLQAKRSVNMSFRSLRNRGGASAMLNHLPAFAMDHTYTLAALYPYATNADGEWAYQGELGYKFKKGTALGGKYGTQIKLNGSYIRSIDATPVAEGLVAGSDGYTSAFFKWGDDKFYQDINVQLDKRWTKKLHTHLMYMNQHYNKTAVEGEGGMIKSNIYVADIKYQFSKKVTLRGELQYLNTKDDQGDWAFGLLELSLAPKLMFTLSDTWNCGETDTHYYQGSVTFNHKSHRLQCGYGRTRAGYNCSGGVCRWVPASKGATVSYNYNF